MELENALDIVDYEFNKIADEVDVERIIAENPESYKDFRRNAKISTGARLKRYYLTGEGIKNQLGDFGYGILGGLGGSAAGALVNAPIAGGQIGRLIPQVARSHNRTKGRINQELINQFGDDAEMAKSYFDAKRAYAHSVANSKRNQE